MAKWLSCQYLLVIHTCDIPEVNGPVVMGCTIIYLAPASYDSEHVIVILYGASCYVWRWAVSGKEK